MAKKNDILGAARKLSKIHQGTSKKWIDEGNGNNALQLAAGYILSDIQKNDSVLYNAMEKTYTEASTELNQLPSPVRRWIQQTGPTGKHSFGCFWDESTPFIVYGGKVFNLSGGTLKADFKNAMIQHVAYTIGVDLAGKEKSAQERINVKTKPAENLAAANTTITAIKAGN